MSRFNFLVSYEGTIEASDEHEARAWAEEEVENGMWRVTYVEVERIKESNGNGN